MNRILSLTAGLWIMLAAVSITAAAQPQVPWRAWQFQELDPDYTIAQIPRAPEFQVNVVILSHEIIWKVSDLYDGTERGAAIRRIVHAAHDEGLQVWVWVHELEDVPPRFRIGKQVQMDRPGFWDWLEDRYERLFQDYPELDGIVLTFHETEHKVFYENEVRSRLSIPDRFARMINTIADVCIEHDKNIVVREFTYEPDELEWFSQGLANVRPQVMLQAKDVPHDFQPFYPHNPIIGRYPDRPLLVEYGCTGEFHGKSRIPYPSPEYFADRWRFALAQPGTAGYIARVQCTYNQRGDALGSPNEINLYTLARMAADPTVTADQIWTEWLTEHYAAAAPWVRRALQPCDDIIHKSFYALEFWVTNHSRLPSFDYFDSHLRSRSATKWDPENQQLAELANQLQHPTPHVLERVLEEKDEALALAGQALEALHQAQPYLDPEPFEDLMWRLVLLQRVAEIWKLHAEACFAYKVLAEDHQVPGLRRRLDRALTGLSHQADLSRTSPIVNGLVPASASEIRSFVRDMRMRMSVPEPVAATIRREGGRFPLGDLSRHRRADADVYEVYVEAERGRETKLLIDETALVLERKQE